MGYRIKWLEQYGINVESLNIKRKILNGKEYWDIFFDHIFNTEITEMSSDEGIDRLVEHVERTLNATQEKVIGPLKKILKRANDLSDTMGKIKPEDSIILSKSHLIEDFHHIYSRLEQIIPFIEKKLDDHIMYRKFINNVRFRKFRVKNDINSLKNLQYGLDRTILLKPGEPDMFLKGRAIPPATLEHAIASKNRELIFLDKLIQNYKGDNVVPVNELFGRGQNDR